jgi:hypothetical protein
VTAWGQFAEARPDMAQLLLGIMEWIPITYLGTVAEDGAPRVHPVCPIIANGRMFVAVAPTSPKRLDLQRDGRYAMHALPGKCREVEGTMRGDDEFYITGRAMLVEDAETRRLLLDTAKHEIRETDWLFEFDIERAMTAYWEKVGQPGTFAVRQYWHASGSADG